MPNTKEQQLAIDTIDCNVSVSAGAGSGKTAVLKQRFLHILEASKSVVDKDNGLDGQSETFYSNSTYNGVKSSNIVGITFTRKAAGEIRTRIREAMLEAMNNGNESFWRMQLKELEKAQINTIHGLCSKILRENPVEANLDPSFVVSEDIDYEAFKEECIHAFFVKALSSDEDNSVKVLTRIYGANSLRAQLSSLSRYFDSIVEEEDLIDIYKKSADLLPVKLAALKKKLEYIVLNRADFVKKTTKAYKALEDMGSDMPLIVSQLETEPYDLSLVDKHLSLRPSGKLTPEIYEARSLSAEIKSCIVDLMAIPLMEHWKDLIGKLNEYIKERKTFGNILTYDDLETRTIELLKNNDEVRDRYHKKYQYFMVDEFQDTNDKQCTLIYLLCGDSETELQGNRLFIVGDRKQSIYRFRGAEVDVFKDVERQIIQMGGKNISMKTNFRSKDKILDCCNETFEQIMGSEGNVVDFEPLDCADFNKDYGVLPELIVINPENDNAKIVESHAVAQKIKELADLELNSEDYISGDKVYSNMAVLLRSMTRVNELTKVFAEYNIPYVVIDGKGFFERQEICDILNIIDIIENPYKNISLAAVLKSPYFGFDDEILAKLTISNDYLWDSINNCNQDFIDLLDKNHQVKLSVAIKKLMELRKSIPYVDVDSTWSKIWEILGVDLVLSIQRNGKQKLANVKKLRNLSLEYCHKYGVDVSEWFEYIKNAKTLGMEETNANLDATDAVQIMTIHKSKGLEFERVFIPFLGAKNHTDSRNIVYAKGVGIGIQLINDKGDLVKTSVFETVKDSEKNKDREERQRILYVAMTRAEKELYMFGVPSKDLRNFDDANWMDQLCLIYEKYDGVNVSRFSSYDIYKPISASEDISSSLSEELLVRINPVPYYFASGRKIFSPSTLNHYLYCQRQYFYSEFMGLPSLDEHVISDGHELSASAMGSIIHEALENYNGKDNLLSVFKNAVRRYAPSANPDKAWNILFGYINSEIYHTIPKKQLREESFFIEAGGLVLEGYIDVLAFNDDGTLSIIDYKTGEPPREGDEELGYMYQLAIYKYAAEKLFRKKVTRAELHFLQNNTVFALNKEDAFDEAISIAKEIASKSKEEEFFCNSDSCKYCSYSYLCNQK